ncbi:MAG: alpha/beta fold hydrolase [Solimonas sp.]
MSTVRFGAFSARGLGAALLLGLAVLGGVARAAELPPLPEAKTLKVFGVDIRYYEMGPDKPDAPTLVLLHGLGSNARDNWGAVMPALAATHRVLALDQLGFGGSAKPIIDYSIQLWVDTLGEFLREKKVGGFTLVGESLGGWIAAQYAIQALQGIAADPAFTLPKPSRLVLCDAAGRRATMEQLFAPPPAGKRGPPAVSLAGVKGSVGAVFYTARVPRAGDLRASLEWNLNKDDGWTVHSVTSNLALLEEAVDGQLDAIRIPTLVIWGEHDRLVPVADGHWYAAGIAGAKLVLIPETAHIPMTEAPDAFLKVLQPFLR